MPQVVFVGLVSGPGGSFSMNSPAHPTDMGGDPGLAGGSEVPDAAVAAVRGPRKRHAMHLHRCRKHRCTGCGWGWHLNKEHKRIDAHIAHKIEAKVY